MDYPAPDKLLSFPVSSCKITENVNKLFKKYHFNLISNPKISSSLCDLDSRKNINEEIQFVFSKKNDSESTMTLKIVMNGCRIHRTRNEYIISAILDTNQERTIFRGMIIINQIDISNYLNSIFNTLKIK